jgi:hypothetical protein
MFLLPAKRATLVKDNTPFLLSMKLRKEWKDVYGIDAARIAGENVRALHGRELEKLWASE